MAPLAPQKFTLNPSLFNTALYRAVQATWFADQPLSSSAGTRLSMMRWFKNPDPALARAFDEELDQAFGPALRSLLPSNLSLPHFTSWTEETASASALAAPFLPAIFSADATGGADAAANADADAGVELDNVEAASFRALSLVLLLDQISRNIFRHDQKLIYTHFDRLARALTLTIMATTPRLDLVASTLYVPARRNWFYMPLMHSENLDDHVLVGKTWRELLERLQERGDVDGAAWSKLQIDFEETHVSILRQWGRYVHRNEVLGRATSKEERAWLEGGGARFGT